MNLNELVKMDIKLLKKNNKKYFTKIKFFLKNRKKYIANYMFWPNALLFYPLLILNNNISKKYIRKQLKIVNRNKNVISNFDDGLLVYLFMKYLPEDDSQVLILENNLFNFTKDYYNKIIPYRKFNQNLSLIDNLGMICPFLCFYGKKNNKYDIVEWSIMQFDDFFNNCYDKKTGLLYHGYNIKTKEKLGILGWGRAMAWILLGLSESIITLKNEKKYLDLLLPKYNLLINNIRNYIKPDGGLGWILSNENEHLDTSATSIILLTLLMLKKEAIIKEEYNDLIQSLYKCLNDNIVKGKVINCSAECKGLGVYPQKYGSYSWSVGPTLACVILYNDIMK